MSADVIAAMRRAREGFTELDGFRFTWRRPTVAEATALYMADAGDIDVARKFVIGWSGIHESDLVPSGGADAVAFSAELWDEWLADRPQWWKPLSDAILGAYRAYSESLKAAEKN